jgi:hypothetical protein
LTAELVGFLLPALLSGIDYNIVALPAYPVIPLSQNRNNGFVPVFQHGLLRREASHCPGAAPGAVHQAGPHRGAFQATFKRLQRLDLVKEMAGENHG